MLNLNCFRFIYHFDSLYCNMLVRKQARIVHEPTAVRSDLSIVRSQLAQHRFRWGQRGSWLSRDSCFVSFCLLSVWPWHEDSSGGRMQNSKVSFWLFSFLFFSVLAAEINRQRSCLYHAVAEDRSTLFCHTDVLLQLRILWWWQMGKDTH